MLIYVYKRDDGCIFFTDDVLKNRKPLICWENNIMKDFYKEFENLINN